MSGFSGKRCGELMSRNLLAKRLQEARTEWEHELIHRLFALAARVYLEREGPPMSQYVCRFDTKDVQIAESLPSGVRCKWWSSSMFIEGRVERDENLPGFLVLKIDRFHDGHMTFTFPFNSLVY